MNQAANASGQKVNEDAQSIRDSIIEELSTINAAVQGHLTKYEDGRKVNAAEDVGTADELKLIIGAVFNSDAKRQKILKSLQIEFDGMAQRSSTIAWAPTAPDRITDTAPAAKTDRSKVSSVFGNLGLDKNKKKTTKKRDEYMLMKLQEVESQMAGNADFLVEAQRTFSMLFDTFQGRLGQVSTDLSTSHGGLLRALRQTKIAFEERASMDGEGNDLTELSVDKVAYIKALRLQKQVAELKGKLGEMSVRHAAGTLRIQTIRKKLDSERVEREELLKGAAGDAERLAEMSLEFEKRFRQAAQAKRWEEVECVREQSEAEGEEDEQIPSRPTSSARSRKTTASRPQSAKALSMAKEALAAEQAIAAKKMEQKWKEKERKRKEAEKKRKEAAAEAARKKKRKEAKKRKKTPFMEIGSGGGGSAVIRLQVLENSLAKAREQTKETQAKVTEIFEYNRKIDMQVDGMPHKTQVAVSQVVSEINTAKQRHLEAMDNLEDRQFNTKATLQGENTTAMTALFDKLKELETRQEELDQELELAQEHLSSVQAQAEGGTLRHSKEVEYELTGMTKKGNKAEKRTAKFMKSLAQKEKKLAKIKIKHNTIKVKKDIETSSNVIVEAEVETVKLSTAALEADVKVMRARHEHLMDPIIKAKREADYERMEEAVRGLVSPSDLTDVAKLAKDFEAEFAEDMQGIRVRHQMKLRALNSKRATELKLLAQRTIEQLTEARDIAESCHEQRAASVSRLLTALVIYVDEESKVTAPPLGVVPSPPILVEDLNDKIIIEGDPDPERLQLAHDAEFDVAKAHLSLEGDLKDASDVYTVLMKEPLCRRELPPLDPEAYGERTRYVTCLQSIFSARKNRNECFSPDPSEMPHGLGVSLGVGGDGPPVSAGLDRIRSKKKRGGRPSISPTAASSGRGRRSPVALARQGSMRRNGFKDHQDDNDEEKRPFFRSMVNCASAWYLGWHHRLCCEAQTRACRARLDAWREAGMGQLSPLEVELVRNTRVEFGKEVRSRLGVKQKLAPALQRYALEGIMNFGVRSTMHAAMPIAVERLRARLGCRTDHVLGRGGYSRFFQLLCKHLVPKLRERLETAVVGSLTAAVRRNLMMGDGPGGLLGQAVASSREAEIAEGIKEDRLKAAEEAAKKGGVKAPTKSQAAALKKALAMELSAAQNRDRLQFTLETAAREAVKEAVREKLKTAVTELWDSAVEQALEDLCPPPSPGKPAMQPPPMATILSDAAFTWTSHHAALCLLAKRPKSKKDNDQSKKQRRPRPVRIAANGAVIKPAKPIRPAPPVPLHGDIVMWIQREANSPKRSTSKRPLVYKSNLDLSREPKLPLYKYDPVVLARAYEVAMGTDGRPEIRAALAQARSKYMKQKAAKLSGRGSVESLPEQLFRKKLRELIEKRLATRVADLIFDVEEQHRPTTVERGAQDNGSYTSELVLFEAKAEINRDNLEEMKMLLKQRQELCDSILAIRKDVDVGTFANLVASIAKPMTNAAARGEKEGEMPGTLHLGLDEQAHRELKGKLNTIHSTDFVPHEMQMVAQTLLELMFDGLGILASTKKEPAVVMERPMGLDLEEEEEELSNKHAEELERLQEELADMRRGYRLGQAQYEQVKTQIRRNSAKCEGQIALNTRIASLRLQLKQLPQLSASNEGKLLHQVHDLTDRQRRLVFSHSKARQYQQRTAKLNATMASHLKSLSGHSFANPSNVRALKYRLKRTAHESVRASMKLQKVSTAKRKNLSTLKSVISRLQSKAKESLAAAAFTGVIDEDIMGKLPPLE